MNILYVSYCVPYDKAYNAGAQTLNYYIKQLVKMTNINIDVVAYCNEKDSKEISLMTTNIRYHLVIRPGGISRFVGRVTSINSKYNPLHKSCNLMTRYSTKLLIKKLMDIAKSDYMPDVVFLEWTQIVLLANDIRKIFPNAKFIASEPDVTYLSFQRKYENEKMYLLKKYKKIKFENCINREITALRYCDYIFVQSQKDKQMITDKAEELENLIGIEKPFYHKSILPRNKSNNDILFFGSMGRIENITAVEWFVKNVMPLINDLPCRFIILGSGITDKLKQLESDKVIMKGFVSSIDEEFSKALCFVCPLLLGAGTKVKVLESLYSGIPVLTNHIGIEGINAKAGVDYIHCEMPEEYAKAIREIYENPDIRINGRALMERDFSLEQSVDNYCSTIESFTV